MSTSLVKGIKSIFKKKKKKHSDDTAETATLGESYTTEPPDPVQYSIAEYDDEFNLPLGLAISASVGAAGMTTAGDGAESASSIQYKASYSNGFNGPSNQSEALSSSYYFNAYVDYDEHITDGFYDVWGEFKEVQRSRKFPSLKALKRLQLEEGDLREVVVLNRSRDSVYPLIENAAQDAVFRLMDHGRQAIIQALAQIVSAQMGGAVMNERALVRSWQKCSQKLKKKYNSAVYPIGKLKVGLSRHRAFLYKALADGLNIGCRLARGYPYRASSAQAVVLVMIRNTEVIVDLLKQPGRLLKLEGTGPDDIGIEVVFAEAPGTPSEPYWIPVWAQKPPRPPLTENDRTGFEGISRSTFVQRIQEEEVQNSQERVQRRAPESAFSKFDKSPFDPPSMQPAGVDMSRDDSIVLSYGARQNSDVSSNSSERVRMNTQTSGTSVFSGSNGWPDDAESPRVNNKNITGVDVRSETSRVSSNNLDEAKKTQTSTNSPTIRNSVSAVISSPFQFAEWPICDDEDERNDFSITMQYSEEVQTPTLLKNDPGIQNKQTANMETSLHSFDADYDIPTSEIEYEPVVRLGVGSYGEVFKGTWRGTEVAVKRLLDQDLSSQILEDFLSEVRILKRLRHPNVLLFMGACMYPPNLAIVTEYLPRGSLYKMLHKTGLEDPRLLLRMARDVAKGMCYLHSHKPPIVHRDLKSPNLLVDKDWTVKVCDFGMSRMKANTYLSGKGAAGTPEWMAPEMLKNERSDEKCDVYSYGVILYEMVTGLEPWANLKPAQVVGVVAFRGQQLSLPTEVDPRIASIMKMCWHRDPQARPSFSDLLKMLSEFDSLPCLPRPHKG